MSRNTSSSSPCASYSFASSTGSPASRNSTKETPFTTRPLSTSKQGMIRLVSIVPFSGPRPSDVDALRDGDENPHHFVVRERVRNSRGKFYYSRGRSERVVG